MSPSKLRIGVLGGEKPSRSREAGYQPVQADDLDESASPQRRLPSPFPPPTPSQVQFAPVTPAQAVSRRRNNRTFLFVFIACCMVCGILAMAGMLPRGSGGLGPPRHSLDDHLDQSGHCRCGDHNDKTSLPDYFQTNTPLFPGPTQTGSAAFLAQTANFAPTGTGSYVPNEPLQTGIPIEGMQPGNRSIFQMMG